MLQKDRENLTFSYLTRTKKRIRKKESHRDKTRGMHKEKKEGHAYTRVYRGGSKIQISHVKFTAVLTVLVSLRLYRQHLSKSECIKQLSFSIFFSGFDSCLRVDDRVGICADDGVGCVSMMEWEIDIRGIIRVINYNFILGVSNHWRVLNDARTSPVSHYLPMSL